MESIEFKKSSRKKRIAAFLIDHFIVTLLLVVIVFVTNPDFFGSNDPHINTAALLCGVVVLFLFFAKDSFKGAGLGKRMMGIMVSDKHQPGSVPSFWRLLIRNLLLIFWPVEFIVLCVDINKERLGDKIAETIVLDNPRPNKKTLKITGLAATGLVAILLVVFFIGNVIKNTDAYKAAIQQIEATPEIMEATGGITGYGILPEGNIQITDDSGQAEFFVKVFGKEKNMEVYISLEKKPQEQWKTRKMEY